MSSRREKHKPFLLPEFCKGCGRCIEACAKHCIELGTEINPRHGPRARSCSTSRTARPAGCASTPARALRPRVPAADEATDFELQDPGEALRRPRLRRGRSPSPIPDQLLALPPLEPLVVKGTYASAIGALLAGCRHFFGYPITPSTEGAELMAKLLPKLDGVFLQAVSEVATVNMMYGCGGAGLPLHDLHLVARLQPDARGDLLHDRRRGARRLRRT